MEAKPFRHRGIGCPIYECFHVSHCDPEPGRHVHCRSSLWTHAPELAENIEQWNGDSRGRWEGATLVIETTNFTAKTNFRGSTDHLHLVERLTRVDADTIDYQFTVTDPTTWTRPWTARIPLNLNTVPELLFRSARSSTANNAYRIRTSLVIPSSQTAFPMMNNPTVRRT